MYFPTEYYYNEHQSSGKIYSFTVLQEMRAHWQDNHTMDNQRSYNIATIPGDGIGFEVVEATQKVLSHVAEIHASFDLRFTEFDWCSSKFQATGQYMSADELQHLKTFDAILFGAVGSPDVPDHISLWNLILPIRKRLSHKSKFNQYVNYRPIRVLPSLAPSIRNCKPADVDWVIIRENSEGEYSGQGGFTHEGTDAIATDVSIYTYKAIERIMRFAFEKAASRPRKLLTMVTKSNAQRYGMVLWDRVFNDLKAEYAHVQTDQAIVDAMTVRMVMKPWSLDVIVATNLHGDILSDLAAALSGSIGVAPSANLDPTRNLPSMFEPIHGSAPDIAGKGLANPVGTFLSAVEMLLWLGEKNAAMRLKAAVDEVTFSGMCTRDLGGTLSTSQVTEAVIGVLDKAKA